MLRSVGSRFDNWTRSAGETGRVAQWAALALAATVFILMSTLIVASDSLFGGRNNISTLQVGDIAPQDIRAPFDWRYESEVLTQRRRETAMETTAPVYDAPDPDVVRQQVSLARQVLDFIDNVRRDPFGTLEQKRKDIQEITSLTLDTESIDYIISLNDEQWRALDGEIINVLERVMRQEIREQSLPIIRTQLPMQVSVRYADKDVNTIAAIASDLIRPNTFPNPDATDSSRQAAADSVAPESRVFERGQIVIREGARIEPVDYEALGQLGLLQTDDRRFQEIARALVMSSLVLVILGNFISRFRPGLLVDVRFLGLIEALFLLVLLGARFFTGETQIYLYPTAALALMLVALTEPAMAIMGMLGLSLLVGLMANKSLEISTLVVVGGLMGTLTLRRSERLNSFFISGLMVALANIAVVITFNLEMFNTAEGTSLGLLLLYSLVNGIFAAAVALAGMYLVTLLFNLPTSLKLVELSQPNQPLLQRLLREAPGTYQHSLQVGNLSEQAANAVGANAELVRVAALYHDIGKMLNPAFFVENQADNVNPHDVLRDPYRSADIIISHVPDGDRLARQYRLPARIRDFIMEHHGTTLVSYFYRQAVQQAEDAEAVDVEQFMYPGPRPRTREAAIMMLADSCESTVRARKPTNKSEISDIVQQIIDARMRDGQLDDSGLTSNDIKTIRNIFVEMLQAVFHPRINYPPLSNLPETRRGEFPPETAVDAPVHVLPSDSAAREHAPAVEAEPRPPQSDLPSPALDDDDSPLPEVPPLRRTQQIPRIQADSADNGRVTPESAPVEDKVENE